MFHPSLASETRRGLERETTLAEYIVDRAPVLDFLSRLAFLAPLEPFLAFGSFNFLWGQ